MGFFGGDQRLDMAFDCLSRDRAVAFGIGDAAGEEIFELELAARTGQIFVRRHPADGGFVHRDGVRDGAQRKRFEVRDALAEKILLTTNDFAGDLDDRFLALVQRLHQPVGAGQAIGEPCLGALVLFARREFDIIIAVDEDAGQRRAVNLDSPAVRGRPHEQVRRDGRGAIAGKAQTGLWVIAAQFADHVRHILFIHAADTAQLGQRAARQQIQIGEQSRHAGIVTVGLLGLQRQTFGQ